MVVKPDLQELIDRAKQADQKAFRALLNYFWEDVYRFQLKRTKDAYEAEEVTVQTFARAFDKIDTYEDSFKFKTWLITISKNIHIDLTRKQKLKTSEIDSRKVSQIADIEPTVEDKIIKEQNLSNLLRQIKELQPHYREVIELRFFKEMSYKEIAVRTDQPITNVKVRLLRAKKLLAEIINHKHNRL